jgi:hypothetical protein
MSEAESDDENDEGDYTVYECPGLASVIMISLHNLSFEAHILKFRIHLLVYCQKRNIFNQ